MRQLQNSVQLIRRLGEQPEVNQSTTHRNLFSIYHSLQFRLTGVILLLCVPLTELVFRYRSLGLYGY